MKTTTVLLAILTAPALWPQTPAEMEALLGRIATYQYGADPAPVVQLDEMVGRLSGSAEKRKMAEGLLLKFVQSGATPAGKESAFRQLSLVGSTASIPVLAPLLAKIDSAEMARYALAAIPGPEADEALRRALAQAPSDRIRIGLTNSLGQRKDAKAVTGIAPLISHANPDVAAAAAAALATIADGPAMNALAVARKSAAGVPRQRLSEAYLVCADNVAGRDKAGAAKIYQEVIAASEPASIHARALKGLAAVDSKAALTALVAELRSNSPDRQIPAIRLMSTMPGADVSKTLLAEYPKLTPLGQIHALTALAARNDAAAKPTVATALKSNDRAVQAAALAALGSLGGPSDVVLLAEAAAAGEEPTMSAARRSLYSVRGSGIDPAIIAAINSTKGKVKTELIVAAGERASASAADALIQASRDSDPDVRREALRAIRNVGGAAQTPALLDMLLKANSAMDRRDATQTLSAVVRRAEPSPVASVITAYKASPSRDAKVSLLEVMGQTSSPEALAVLRDELKNPEPEIVRSAILALTSWDNSSPIPDLMNIAKTAQRPTEELATPAAPPAGGGRGAAGGGRGGGGGRGAAPPTNNIQILALRGVLRLAVLQSDRTPAQSGRLLAEVMSLSTQVAEKRNVLGLLSYFPSKEALEVAQAATRDAVVANEARVALAQVTEGLNVK